MNNIRNLNKLDLSIIYDFFNEQKEEFDKFKQLGWTSQNVIKQINKMNNYSIGYFYKNKIVGILIGEILHNNDKSDLEVHIMFVSKIYRRKKIGCKILKYLESNKNVINIKNIYLEVSENNLEAINFYEKNNFFFLNLRNNYYKEDNKTYNAKCYQKKL